MERGADNAHLGSELDPVLLERASELNRCSTRGEAEEAGAAVASAVAARPLAAPAPSSDVDVARRVVARWRALVAERKGVLLLRLLALPDLFGQEVLKRLLSVDRTMVAQVGRPWLAAVLASGFPRSPKRVRERLQLRDFCTSAERLAWARANGCPWSLSNRNWWTNPCALAAGGGHLEALQWARQHGCPWDEMTCRWPLRADI